jgi:hypothetical protein
MSAKQPVREHQTCDISHFWVNNVTLMKLLKIANRKFHDLFQLCRESTEKLSFYRETNGTKFKRGNTPIISAGKTSKHVLGVDVTGGQRP